MRRLKEKEIMTEEKHYWDENFLESADVLKKQNI